MSYTVFVAATAVVLLSVQYSVRKKNEIQPRRN
jgi:hypothetical protein